MSDDLGRLIAANAHTVHFPPPVRCDECGGAFPDEGLVMFDDETYCVACWEADQDNLPVSDPEADSAL